MWFSAKKTEPSFVEQLIKHAIEDMAEIAADVAPNLKEELLAGARLKNLYNNPNVKASIISLEQLLAAKLKEKMVDLTNPSDSSSTQTTKEKMERISIKMNEYKKVMEEKDVTFFERFQFAKKFVEFFKSKKNIKVVCVGNTQVGKTNSLKYLMNLPDDIVKIGKGVESDTSVIKEYSCEQNGVEFLMCDFPGFYDSKGRSGEFYKEMVSYMRKNDDKSPKPIDAILWFAKLGDIADEKLQDTVSKLVTDLGTDFLKQTIIILTFANSVKPPSIYYNDAVKLLKESGKAYKRQDIDLLAWKEYTTSIKQAWKNTFSKFNNEIDIVLVENNEFENGKYDTGIGRLKDETPIVETFYDTLFSVIGTRKKAVAFMFLAGHTANTSTVTPVSTEVKTSAPAVLPVILTEQQNALNNMVDKKIAATKAATPGSETNTSNSGGGGGGGWCVIL